MNRSAASLRPSASSNSAIPPSAARRVPETVAAICRTPPRSAILRRRCPHQGRIEMQRIPEPRRERVRSGCHTEKLASLTKRRCQTILRHRAGTLLLLGALPVMLERTVVDRATKRAERMPVAMPRPRPILEHDAELIGRLGGVHEGAFVLAEKAQEIQYRRYRRLAHAHDRHVRRFDDDDLHPPLEHPRQCGGGDPARGATAEYHNLAYRLLVHARPDPSFRRRKPTA